MSEDTGREGAVQLLNQIKLKSFLLKSTRKNIIKTSQTETLFLHLMKQVQMCAMILFGGEGFTIKSLCLGGFRVLLKEKMNIWKI